MDIHWSFQEKFYRKYTQGEKLLITKLDPQKEWSDLIWPLSGLSTHILKQISTSTPLTLAIEPD